MKKTTAKHHIALLLGLVVFMVGCASFDSSAHVHTENPLAEAQFDLFCSLAGEWQAVGGNHAAGASHVYRTIANGSAVVETAFPGEPHEMVTVFHIDGDQLVLTHYCAAGNQPRMIAGASSGKEVRFEFAGAGNMESLDEVHMHDASFDFTNPDRLLTTWSYWEGGEHTALMEVELVRVKSE